MPDEPASLSESNEERKRVPIDKLAESRLLFEQNASVEIIPAAKANGRRNKRSTRAQAEMTKQEQLRTEAFSNQIQRDKSEHDQIIGFRRRLFWFSVINVSLWQVCIIVLVALQRRLEIPANIMLALITTTTVNVFGFLLIVMNFVFHRPARRPVTPRPKASSK